MLTYKIQGLNADPNFFAHNLFSHISIKTIVPYAKRVKKNTKNIRKTDYFAFLSIQLINFFFHF